MTETEENLLQKIATVTRQRDEALEVLRHADIYCAEQVQKMNRILTEMRLEHHPRLGARIKK